MFVTKLFNIFFSSKQFLSNSFLKLFIVDSELDPDIFWIKIQSDLNLFFLNSISYLI